MLASFWRRPARALVPFALVFAVAVFAAPAQVWAFAIATTTPTSKTIQRWFSNNVMFYMHPACSPDVKNDVCKDQLRAGWKGWMAQTCTALKFTEGYHCNTAQGKCLFDKNVICKADADCPAANNLNVAPMGYNTNSRNELVWIETSNWKFGQYVLGVTSPVTYNNGAIFEADIAFNGYQYKWVADPGSIGGGLMDILSVAIHEQGHFFGVQHMLPGSYGDKDPPTMAPSVDPFGKSASLTVDDGKAICFLNPKDATYKCANDADCPYVNEKDKSSGQEYYAAKLTCASGVCGFGGSSTTPVGTSDLGGGCAGDKDCKSPLFCQPAGNKGYCSQLCVPQQKNCPTGFTCFAYQGKPTQGACLPSSGQTVPTKLPGEPCGNSGECKSLMCLSGVCRVKCTPASPVECNKDTETCAPIPATGIGACVPDDKPKLKPVGSACAAPTECENGLCLKDSGTASTGVCRLPCKGKGSCPDGFACVPQSGGFEACMPGSDKLPAGSECKAPADCLNGPCVAYGGKQFCSQTCKAGDAGACPCGMTCEESTAGHLCLPGKKVGCAEIGSQCSDTSECVSGALCFAGACQLGCDVRNATNCGPGEGCQRVEANTPQGACVAVGKGQLSDACQKDGDCQSLFCDVDVTNNGEKRCLKPCDPDNDQCGTGFVCNAVTDYVGGCLLADAVPSKPTAGADAGGDTGAVGNPGLGGGTGGTGGNTGNTGGGGSSGGLCAASRSASSSAPLALLLLAIGAGAAMLRARRRPA